MIDDEYVSWWQVKVWQRLQRKLLSQGVKTDPWSDKGILMLVETPEWSHDVNTGLWLVESDQATWILASDWSEREGEY